MSIEIVRERVPHSVLERAAAERELVESVKSHHSELAAQRWRTMDICEQLANVGSEVERSLMARESGKTERFERALELFDWTAQDDRWRGPRRREVLRARTEFVRLFFDPNCDPHKLRDR